MTVFTYSRVSAFNPNTTPVSVARSATGNVYDIGDTGFLTPLNLTLVATNTVTTTLVSDANAMFPDFTLVDRTSVVFKSGTSKMVLTTTTPIPGPTGAASTVPGPAGPPTTDASLLTAGTVADARLPGRLSVGELSATIGLQLKPRGEDQNTLGIPTDGVSDCRAAFNEIPAGTGRVHLNGKFPVSGPVVLQSGVHVMGTDRSKTIIEAGPGFVGTAVVQLGTEAVAFDTGLSHMAVDAKGLADVGVTALNMQEFCGLDHVLVTNWLLGGVDFSAGQNQNYDIRTLEIYGKTGSVKPNSVGLKTGPGRARILQSLTVINAGAVNAAAPASSTGVLLQSPASVVDGAHFEGCTVGMDLNGATGSVISGVSGSGGVGIVTDLVRVRNIGQDNIKLQGLFPNGSTNTLNDLIHNFTYAGALSNYEWGGGAVGQETLLTTAYGAASRTQGSHHFTGGVIAGGGSWNNGNLRLGGYYLWVDAAGNLRIKSGAPTSDLDGTVVGVQT